MKSDLLSQLNDYGGFVEERLPTIATDQIAIPDLQPDTGRNRWSHHWPGWVYAALAAVVVLIAVGGLTLLLNVDRPEPADTPTVPQDLSSLQWVPGASGQDVSVLGDGRFFRVTTDLRPFVSENGTDWELLYNPNQEEWQFLGEGLWHRSAPADLDTWVINPGAENPVWVITDPESQCCLRSVGGGRTLVVRGDTLIGFTHRETDDELPWKAEARVFLSANADDPGTEVAAVPTTHLAAGALADRFVLVGIAPTIDEEGWPGPPYSHELFTSDDGSVWRESAIPDNTVLLDIEGTRVLAVSTDPTGERTTIHQSLDGQTWTVLTHFSSPLTESFGEHPAGWAIGDISVGPEAVIVGIAVKDESEPIPWPRHWFVAQFD